MIFISLFAVLLPLFSFSKSPGDSDRAQVPSHAMSSDPVCEASERMVFPNLELGNFGHSDQAQVPDNGGEAFGPMISQYSTKFGLLGDNTIFEISKFLLYLENMKLVNTHLHKSLSLTSNLRFYSRFAFSIPEISDFSVFDPEVEYILSNYSRFNKKNLFVFLCHDLFVMDRFSRLQIPIARFLARIYNEIIQIDPHPLRDLVLDFKPVLAEFLLDREEYRVFLEISDDRSIFYFFYHKEYFSTFKFIVDNRKYYQKFIEILQSIIGINPYELHMFISQSIKHKVPFELFEQLIRTFSDFENFLSFLLLKNILNNPSDYEYYRSVLNHFLAKFPSEQTEEFSLLIAVRFEEESSHHNDKCVEEFKNEEDHSFLMHAALLSRNISLLRHLIDNGVNVLDYLSPSALFPIPKYSAMVFALFADSTESKSRLLTNYNFIYSIIKNYSYDSLQLEGIFLRINFIVSPVPESNYTVPIVLNLSNQDRSRNTDLISLFFNSVWSQIDEDESVAKFENFFAIYLNVMENYFYVGSCSVNLTEKSMVFFSKSEHLIQMIRNRNMRFSLNEKMTGVVFETRNLHLLGLLRDLIEFHFQMNDLTSNLKTEEQIVNVEHFFSNDIVTLLFSDTFSSPHYMRNWKPTKFFKLRPVIAYILKTPTLRKRIIEFRYSNSVFSLIQLEFPEDMREILNY